MKNSNSLVEVINHLDLTEYQNTKLCELFDEISEIKGGSDWQDDVAVLFVDKNGSVNFTFGGSESLLRFPRSNA